ncbi:hypothetical protein MNBD_ACTINO02-2736 [hydrothermal vent metagenome]|uniref:DUF2520 domain-containing protein n=1 Tax=hydrothermal vent metagenome TaxID=652676 RepID=A0A3B0TRN9_9ZZZZ
MRITLIGPGRAGLSIAYAAKKAGHEIVTVVARRPEAARRAAEKLGATASVLDRQLEASDLWIVATRDDAILSAAESLAQRLDEGTEAPDMAIHLSGLSSIETLAPLRGFGISIGSVHPLQTMPNPEIGQERLRGAWFGITAEPELYDRLAEFVESLGGRPFSIVDSAKPTYHAAAAAAANFTLVNLIVAQDLLDAVDIPIEVLGPLMEAIVANALEIGPRAALTGPVARGDVDTVAAQIAAVADHAPAMLGIFVSNVASLAKIAGRWDQFADLVAEHTS